MIQRVSELQIVSSMVVQEVGCVKAKAKYGQRIGSKEMSGKFCWESCWSSFR